MNREISIDIEDAYINYDALQNIFGIPDKLKYDIHMETANYPRGNSLPRKKRIRNKWIKKYHKEHKIEDVFVDFELE